MNVGNAINDAALSELASEVILMYPAGAEFRAEDVLASNPDLAASRRSVIKISLEEYCRRYDNDESIDVNEFLERFPGIESSLRAEINIHSEMLRNPAQFDKWLAPQWPVPDTQFFDWRIRRLIGRGGFSRVYLADESKVGNRPVALKLTTRTGHECELVGRLSHPGICQILSVRDDGPDGITAIAMPYHGEATLQDLIESAWHGRHTRTTSELPDWGPVSTKSFVDGVTNMAIRLCEALEYAHGQNVLHCDLKPSNVLLKSDGSPILLDFNLAFSTTSDSRVLGGTVGYMSPEQIDATLHRNERRPIDTRADVFGLGAVLYHVLAGSPAFTVDDSGNDNDRMLARLTSIVSAAPVALYERNSAVGHQLGDLVQRCLAANPADRPSSIGEVRRVLEECVKPMEPARQVAGTAHERWTRRLRLTAWSTAVVAMLAAIILLNTASNRGSLDLDQEIERLEALADDFITPADRELLGYYYCLDARWLQGKRQLQSLIDLGFESAAIHHNLAYCQMKLSETQSAYDGFLEAIAIDPSQSPSWIALTYYDAAQAVNERRFPYFDYLQETTAISDNDEMLDELSRYVHAVEAFQRDRSGSRNPNDSEFDLESFAALGPLSTSLHEFPLNNWLVAPTGLSDSPVNQLIATK